MKKLILNEKAYELYLKPYYENLTRERAVLGSLFSVDKEGLSDDELKMYIATLVKDYLEVTITERSLYYNLRNTFSLPPSFNLDDHTISYKEEVKCE